MKLFSIKPASELKGLKNRLRGAEVLFPGELKGPESFASYNGEIYTGVHGGYVTKLEENRIVPIVKFGKKCDGIWEEEKCGRPLGLNFNEKGDLYVVDAYYGIFKIDMKTKQYKLLINTSEPIDGKVSKIPNSLHIAKNGDIYWTVSSTEFTLQDGTYSLLTNPSGRLIRYNAATKKNEVLLDNLGFANGVILSEDESFVLVLECMSSRIIKYNLKGPNAGKKEIFSEALPGVPDNVHSDGQGGFLVSLIMYGDEQYPLIFQSLTPHPYIRKMIVRLLYLMEAPFKLLEDIYPNPYAKRLIHSIGSFESANILDFKKTSVVLRMDKTGKILDAIYSDDQKVYGISSAFIHNDYLWLGSPTREDLLRVPLKQAFPDLVRNKQSSNIKSQKQSSEPQIVTKKVENVKNEPKPVKVTTAKPPAKPTTATTTPRPTTTTPKPTTTTPRPTTTTTTTPRPTTTTTPKPSTTTTARPPTTTTPKPTTQAPRVEKPVTTTPKPTASATKKPVTTQPPPTTRRPPAQASTTVKPPTTTPPTPKAPTNNVKEGNPKAPSKPNVDTKSGATNVKTETPNKVNKAPVNSKHNEPVKQNTRDAQSEKVKPTEKNRPKDAAPTK